ncbi:MAG: ATP-binding protein, partial [Clostridiales bacterium]|nr:ATP-binding protein [Clostridiales bacterium]
MNIELHLLSFFSPVLEDAGLRGLATAQSETDPVAVADGMSAFFRALTESGESTAAHYLAARLTENENTFSRQAATGDPAKLSARANAELNILKAFIETDCADLARKLPQNARSLCPAWESGTFTLTASALADEYARGGYGAVRLSPALLFDKQTLDFVPVKKVSPLRLCDLKEYAEEKAEAVRNTLAFIEGKPANNVLFYGDRGTGKSSTVHALLNEFAPRGLRLVHLD